MDLASEMLYPVVPAYLQNIGFTVFWIGLLEGVAEFIAGLTKGYFGQESDRKAIRLPFIRWGYTLSAFSKPLMALWANLPGIFLARSFDRLGKGMRSAPRDALLSSEATPETKARIFNFHRGWDTAGAVLGPILALIYLQVFPGRYVNLFYLALLPGIASVLLLFFLRENKPASAPVQANNFFSYWHYWKQAPKAYRTLAALLLLFALANSSDVFLLLQAKAITGNDSSMILSYLLYNTIYAAAAFPLGIAADRIGMKKILAMGWILFCVVYAGFAWNTDSRFVYVLFGIYGIFAAASEGIAKALLSNILPPARVATGLGLFSSLQSIVALFASFLSGWIWTAAGSFWMFMLSAMLAVLAFVLLMANSRMIRYENS